MTCCTSLIISRLYLLNTWLQCTSLILWSCPVISNELSLKIFEKSPVKWSLRKYGPLMFPCWSLFSSIKYYWFNTCFLPLKVVMHFSIMNLNYFFVFPDCICQLKIEIDWKQMERKYFNRKMWQLKWKLGLKITTLL